MENLSYVALGIVIVISCIVAEIIYQKFFDKNKKKREKRFEQMQASKASEQLMHERAMQKQYDEE